MDNFLDKYIDQFMDNPLSQLDPPAPNIPIKDNLDTKYN